MKAADVETRFLVAPVAEPMQGERPGGTSGPAQERRKERPVEPSGVPGATAGCLSYVQQEPGSGRCGVWDTEPFDDVTTRTRERYPPADPTSL